MKSTLFTLCGLLGTVAPWSTALGQAGYLYDQQSSADGSYVEGGLAIQPNQPMGQSFTPLLSSIGFARLMFYAPVADGVPSTLVLRLHALHISTPAFATSAQVTIPDSAIGYYAEFHFNPEVQLTPGQTYFLQPWIVSGDDQIMAGAGHEYSGGMAFSRGSSLPSLDLWFREGIIIPEPGAGAVLALGLGLFAVRRCKAP